MDFDLSEEQRMLQDSVQRLLADQCSFEQRQALLREDGAGHGTLWRQFAELGFELVATGGTGAALQKAGLKVQRIFKLAEGRPNAVDLLKNRLTSKEFRARADAMPILRRPSRRPTRRRRCRAGAGSPATPAPERADR